VRDLVRSLGAEGRTVFVSSHLLSEVRQTCDSVAILARGRCVAAGPVREVLAAGHETRLIVRVAELERAAAVLCAAGISAGVSGDVIRVALPASEGERVTRTLAAKRMYVTELRADEADLEQVFLELTRDREDVPA
jgi:ABC-2 type transport system ATP-binding protein